MNSDVRSDPLDKTLQISAVVPLYNEHANVVPLLDALISTLATITDSFEIILVDDGSSDGTTLELLKASQQERRIRPVILARNYGQSTALQAGFEAAKGDIIVSLDGDLQNDPRDIPRLIDVLQRENADLVSGWRKKRHDGPLRVFISRQANRLISRLTKVTLHDYGCTLKAYRRDVLDQITVLGELHRFIPALLAEVGGEVREVEVNHRPRVHGRSKYGLDRTFRVALDLLLIVFLRRYVQRPIHFFGALGLAFGLAGFVMICILSVEKFIFGEAIGNRPMLSVALSLAIAGVILVVQGLTGELIIRLLHAAGARPQYRLKPERKVQRMLAEAAADDTRPN